MLIKFFPNGKGAGAGPVGYLVAESDDYLLLAGTLGLGDRQSNARFAIPKGCVLERERLDTARAASRRRADPPD